MLIFFLLLTGCSTPNNPDVFTVGLVVSVAGLEDNSFNEAAWAGLHHFKEKFDGTHNIELVYLLSETPDDYEKNFHKFGKDELDLVLAGDPVLKDALLAVAGDHPPTKFAIIDAGVGTPDLIKGEGGLPNVINLSYKVNEGAFLLGVAAAMMTETNVVGFIGGADIELVNKYEAGFLQGVMMTNPDVKILGKYVGNFTDEDKSYTLATEMIKEHADIIFQVAGPAGAGVSLAASEHNQVRVIETSDYQAMEQLDILTMVKRPDVLASSFAHTVLDGDFPWGLSASYGLAARAMDINLTGVSEEIQEKITDFKQQIIDGDLEVIEFRNQIYDQFPELKDYYNH